MPSMARPLRASLTVERPTPRSFVSSRSEGTFVPGGKSRTASSGASSAAAPGVVAPSAAAPYEAGLAHLRAERYLDAQRAAHLRRMHELTMLKRTGSLMDTLLADYGLFHLEADLHWIDATTARLGELAEMVRTR